MRSFLLRLTTGTLLLVLGLVSTLGIAQGKIHYTYPMPRKVKPADPLNVNPGFQVPEFQDNYQFVSAPSKYAGTDKILVFSIENNRRARIGSMPAGTAIKMTSIAVVGKTIYYAVPWQIPGAGRPQIAWISGLNIKASAFDPSVK